MDEEMKSAMDECGLDSDDEDMSKAFAAGVEYGEKLEKSPEEREKLDREHESNGLKSAMDACGVDAENPQESRAFAEGVKYGEKLERNPDEREKLDKEHESEGAKEALDEDKNAEIAKLLDEVPGLTDAQKKQLTASLQDLAYAKSTGDEDMPAQDRALRKKPKTPRPLLAHDAAIIRAQAVADAQNNMRRVAKAIGEVRPLVGDLDMMAFDSASDVYGYTLEQCGVDKRKYEKAAWRGMVITSPCLPLIREPASYRIFPYRHNPLHPILHRQRTKYVARGEFGRRVRWGFEKTCVLGCRNGGSGFRLFGRAV